MIAFGNIKQGALLALTFFWLTACTSSGPTLDPTPETPHSTTVNPPLGRADEKHARQLMSQGKPEESGRIADVLKQAAAPTSVVGLSYDLRYPSEPINTENYAHFDDNPVKRAIEQPVSTFSIDVDTGAYANVRRFLNQGSLPVQDAVRVEEMINYFSYDYPLPKDKTRPFSVTTEMAPTPWNKDTYLLRVGLKGYDIAAEKLPSANLVFLVDVSGSMMSPDKLPLLKSGLKLLVQKLRAQDRVSLVVYAGNTGIVLEPTAGDQQARIIAALDGLEAGGSTNGGAGITLAYAMAEQGFIKNGINRVLLATDGDFNVGTVNFEALKNMVEDKRKTGVSLTTLGFGTGNYNDRLMEQLADAGNGNYAYIDTLHEANKVLVNEISSTLQTIAKDVKIQIEFNPAMVAEYRLIGYENRALKREDFNNDKIDAGDIGAGHTVTALYEITLADGKGQKIDPLRYGAEKTAPGNKEEIALLRLRYKLPDSDNSQLIEQALKTADMQRDAGKTSADFRFSAAVAAFGQLLRGGKYIGDFSYDDIATLARDARAKDDFGYRGEFLTLVNLAKSLDSGNRQVRR
ncbi:MAG: VWA domain-containing protein [Gammaproteobacteria bacterium]|nr:VWA domain-containing protein [Gammaproteobacteria bacterium]